MTSEVPEGWKETCVGKIISGNNKSKIQVGQANDTGKYKFFTSGEAVLKYDEWLVDGENLFMATGGVANVKYFDGECAYSTDTYSLKSSINTQLLYYLLTLKIDKINYSLFEGTGLKHLQKPEFKDMVIHVPKDPKEQEKIAEILEKVDENITITEKLINKYVAMETGLIWDLLTKGISKEGSIRNSFENNQESYIETPIGNLPKEWEVVQLKKYKITSLYGPRFNAENYNENGNVKTIRGTDFTKEGEILYEQAPKALLPFHMVNTHKLKDNDILIVTTADCGLTAVFEDQGFPFIPSAYTVKYKFSEKVNPFFVKYYMTTSIAKKQVEKYIRQGTLGNLPGSDLFRFWIQIPSRKEQDRIVEIIENSRKRLFREKNNLLKYQKMKSGLMQDLLTGKVKVAA
jgi:type I restriction enzyme, S subunit